MSGSRQSRLSLIHSRSQAGDGLAAQRTAPSGSAFPSKFVEMIVVAAGSQHFCSFVDPLKNIIEAVHAPVCRQQVFHAEAIMEAN